MNSELLIQLILINLHIVNDAGEDISYNYNVTKL